MVGGLGGGRMGTRAVMLSCGISVGFACKTVAES